MTVISEQLRERREAVFLYLAGFFICSMTLLNVIGITKFIQLGPMALAIGVLPYPLTFLCTDLVCELYGKQRANRMVTVGLVLNVFILAVLFFADLFPSAENPAPWQILHLSKDIMLPSGEVASNQIELFKLLYLTTTGAVFASMLAYIAAQYIDVQLFHFWKRVTKGKHLWIRNNFSTLISQGVDSVMVISVTFGAAFLRGEYTLNIMLGLMASNYLFKMCAALVDTPFFYLFTHYLRRNLQFDEHPFEQIDKPASIQTQSNARFTRGQ
jgi:queuosine precursor transporter